MLRWEHIISRPLTPDFEMRPPTHEAATMPISPEELQRITDLLKHLGFDVRLATTIDDFPDRDGRSPTGKASSRESSREAAK